MSGKKRGLRTALGACAAVAATTAGLGGLGVSPAGAAPYQSDPNPLSTNVPYLAWRGEHVRLVKCDSDLPGADATYLSSKASGSDKRLPIEIHANTDVLVEDWSGLADFQPKVASGTVDLFYSREKGLCVKADVISQKAGIAMIKLMVSIDPGADSDLVDILTRSEILDVHQFLVGWMSLGTPSINELNVGGDFDPAAGATAGTNQFNASNDPSKDGVVRATLTGTIPLGNDFDELGLGSSLTLPNQWPDLAKAMASDRNVDNPLHTGTQYRWDIHDSNAPVEGHPLEPYACNDGLAVDAAVGLYGDAVDNCEGGLSFSRVFDASGQTGPLAKYALDNTDYDTIGPFDPQRPDETFLGDGNLTPDDAPMPSARLDVSIAAGGIGSLQQNDKQKWFSRDRSAASNAGSGADTAHNLYAPFYDSYIPATNDGSFLLHGTPVSGTDGPSTGNNFPGYLADSPYHFWDIAHVLSYASAQDTNCLHRIDGYPQRRQTPEGPQSVVLYTDEHGMAQVNYRAGTGANYNALGDRNNANGGCDLKGVDVLGNAAISATAQYPYQPTTDITPRISNTITKTVHSLFSKELTVWPKGSSADLQGTRIVVAHAQDVDGTPEAGETVCFIKSTAAGQIRPYVYNGFNARYVGGYDLAGSSIVDNTHDNSVCMKTNAAGNAAIEVTSSEHELVDITGDFTSEGLLRDRPVNFAAAIPPTDQTPAGPGPAGTDSTPPAVGPITTAPITTVPPAVADQVNAIVAGLGIKSGAPKVSSKLATVRYAHLTSVKGKRSLVVRLDGSAQAKVRIKLFNKKGKSLAKLETKIATGKSVKVSGLKITKAVVRASVKVIG